ncbi:hypothetical protein [Pseudanabaena yagii]|uniref:YcxB-like protein domain-containing protein n=1 Tax=Pseudanabaena yagii GIHE-NHR1 TaxID=2722753 RepID=A0ABX1LQ61_9CYAN|nr:hypothetical protein [Pseudanabaena yagii]NMF57481.1 hypothetical protein [Pseudanabaena yagii GIHE-NHR1]
MNDEFQYKFELVKQEIDLLQSGIRNCDSSLFTIKGWAITIFSTFIFFAADKKQPLFLLFCAMAIVLFWLLDSTYRSIQRIYIRRYNEIEHYLQSLEFSQAIKERNFRDFYIPKIGAGFNVKGIIKYTEIFQVAFMYHNALGACHFFGIV